MTLKDMEITKSVSNLGSKKQVVEDDNEGFDELDFNNIQQSNGTTQQAE